MYIFSFCYLWLEFNIISTIQDNFGPHIIGGYPCSTEYHSFVVSIRYKKNWRKHICGGTLIKRDWVLTAAHCVQFGQTNPKNLVIILYTSKSRIDGKESQYVQSIYVHPESNIKPFHNDAALLKLQSPFRTKLYLVELPPSPVDGDISSICKKPLLLGWGLTSPWDPAKQPLGSLKSDSFNGQLRCVRLPILPAEICKEYIDSMDVNTFCTMYKEGGKDSCLGDSGGPVMCHGIQYGIISHAYGCALKDEPSFNVRTDRMLDFIESVFLRSHGHSSVILLPYVHSHIFTCILNFAFCDT